MENIEITQPAAQLSAKTAVCIPSAAQHLPVAVRPWNAGTDLSTGTVLGMYGTAADFAVRSGKGAPPRGVPR